MYYIARAKMKFLYIFVIPLLILIASVPWFFTGESSRVILGFPAWGFYSLILSLIYAVVVAIFLKKFWSLSAQDEEKE